MPQDSTTKADVAKLQCKELAKACEAFYVRHGQMPSNLADLTSATIGSPILKDQRALIDPWNQPYQMKKVGEALVVFTTNPSNGQKISSAD